MTPHPQTPTGPYRDREELETLLTRVFRGPATQEDLLTGSRLAVAFTFTAPDLTVTVDGRTGAWRPTVRFGPQAVPAPLTFSMSGETAHRFWRGELNVMTALGFGQLRLQGSLISALKIAPMMPGLQRAYREAWADLHPEDADAGAPDVS